MLQRKSKAENAIRTAQCTAVELVMCAREVRDEIYDACLADWAEIVASDDHPIL